MILRFQQYTSIAAFRPTYRPHYISNNLHTSLNMSSINNIFGGPRLAELEVPFFAGNRLNRLSHLRSNSSVLDGLYRSPRSKFLPFQDLEPLFRSFNHRARRNELHFLGYDEVKSVVGESWDDVVKSNRIVVLLGLDEDKEKAAVPEADGLHGVPYWAVDLSNVEGLDNEKSSKLVEELENQGHQFLGLRPHAFKLPKALSMSIDASILAQGVSMIDWNSRNIYCPNCGVKTVSGEAGYKRVCPPVNSPEQKSRCLTHQRRGVQNFSYPRTDPVVIVCVVSPDGEKVMVGRQKVWPQGMYSCVAGFMEPGETIEEAARREVKEETGITLGQVTYIQSQPWPFPNSLMIGCMGVATEETISLVDKELEDAKWMTASEVKSAFQKPFALRPRSGSDLEGSGIVSNDEVKFPPMSSLASILMSEWLRRYNGKSEVGKASKM
ncbi:NUDIX hydrolase domain-like protein [Paraphysoderma sedebokerense]|nr:NUDIX hydrolase domain-like protein [Paraphysoderma sedebokerense]